MASSLVWGKKFRGKIRRRFIKMMAASLAGIMGLLILILIVILAVSSGPPGPVIGVGLFLSLILSAVPLRLVQSRWERKLRLSADQTAAQLVGREFFLQVLKKIDQMSLRDVESRKRSKFQLYLTGRPSITDRIDSLEKPLPPPPSDDYHWPEFVRPRKIR